MEVTTGQVCDLLEIDRSTLLRWRKSGMPGFIRRGVWDLKKIHSWWASNIHTSETCDNESIVQARERYWIAKADRERVRADLEKGNVVSRDKIKPVWTARTAEVSAMLAALAKRLPPLLEGKDQYEMQRAIGFEVWRIKDSFCRAGRFTEIDDPENDMTKVPR